MYICVCMCCGRHGLKEWSDIQSPIMKSKLCTTWELPFSPFHIPSLNCSFILQLFYKNKHWHKIIYIIYYIFSTNTLTTIIVVASSGICMPLCRKSWCMQFAVVTDWWIDQSKKKKRLGRMNKWLRLLCVQATNIRCSGVWQWGREGRNEMRLT